MTAWQSLVTRAKLQAGQRVLIHAGAGGVGTFAVQFAHLLGAHVITTASAHNHGLVADLGADEVIDYTTTAFEDVARGIDVVLDTIGAETRRRSWQTLAAGGVLVSLGATPHPPADSAPGVRGVALGLVRPSRGQLERIAAFIEDGRVRPVVQAILPLGQATQAQALSRAGHVQGKLVLVPPPSQ